VLKNNQWLYTMQNNNDEHLRFTLYERKYITYALSPKVFRLPDVSILSIPSTFKQYIANTTQLLKLLLKMDWLWIVYAIQLLILQQLICVVSWCLVQTVCSLLRLHGQLCLVQGYH